MVSILGQKHVSFLLLLTEMGSETLKKTFHLPLETKKSPLHACSSGVLWGLCLLPSLCVAFPPSSWIIPNFSIRNQRASPPSEKLSWFPFSTSVVYFWPWSSPAPSAFPNCSQSAPWTSVSYQACELWGDKNCLNTVFFSATQYLTHNTTIFFSCKLFLLSITQCRHVNHTSLGQKDRHERGGERIKPVNPTKRDQTREPERTHRVN